MQGFIPMMCDVSGQFFSVVARAGLCGIRWNGRRPCGVAIKEGESAMIYQRSCAYPQQTFAPRQGCNCPSQSALPALPEHPVVAMAYVPFQTDITVYDAANALQRGTAFPVLDKPFLAGCRQ